MARRQRSGEGLGKIAVSSPLAGGQPRLSGSRELATSGAETGDFGQAAGDAYLCGAVADRASHRVAVLFDQSERP